MTMLALAAVLSLLIGVVLGMLGGGGAILTLPMLVYAVGLEPKNAIATSLFVVGATSVMGTAVNARARRVRWKAGGMFGLAAMVGAYAGGRVAQLIPGAVLLVGFGTLMLVTAIAMLKERKGEVAPRALRLGRALALGAAVGLVSGLVGAGGGFLIVPALTLFGGLAIREAIATSLFVITLQSFAGFAGHVTHAQLDWTLVLVITAASLVGSLAGATFGSKVSPRRLRRGFAWLVLVMGLFMFAKELPITIAVLAAMLTFFAVFLVLRVPHPGLSRNTDPSGPPTS